MEKKIVGARKANFTPRDGSLVEGFMVSMTSPIASDLGTGVDAECFYITKAKLDSWGIDIMAVVGRKADVFYGKNRVGKTAVVGLSVKG